MGRLRLRRVAIALILVALVAITGRTLAPQRRMPPPGPEASPEKVVQAYVAALNARDFRTSNGLAPRGPQQVWWHWPSPTIEHLRVVESRRPRPGSDEVRDSSLAQWPQVAVVETEGDFRHWSGMDDGTRHWTFLLGRLSDAEAWTIVDWGQA